MTNSKSIVCFGEILWDVFPDRTVIGGAPFNVAMRLHTLGAHSIMVSSLGDDEKGKIAINYIKECNFSREGIQLHPNLPTGEVAIQLDEKRNASYNIVHPVAWDAIEVTSSLFNLVKDSSLFVFGSLAARSEISRNTLFQLLPNASYKIFDVNLRAPHYNYEMIQSLLTEADFVKMNEDELIEIANYLDLGDHSLKEHAFQLLDKFSLHAICITKGAHGAMLIVEDKFYEQTGYAVKVEDIVGAGDSFLACLLYELFIREADPQLALQRSCAMGALVASKEGAGCKVSEDEINAFVNRNP